ncbi:outer membrane beta-barrel protein [Parabacteroides sp. PF5-9]|uniref:outer membrane beta-barrel protein n=1 Tax=Parabacteroides sp. PF5-9 TaxID=1742404 RepID=UPI00247321AC|nr:outer membrane beta-barrel protein [Parabacteroides sp. PF5-9]MDH6359237.1 hypothetical protein [Parabacteroides sp. PF5-9]
MKKKITIATLLLTCCMMTVWAKGTKIDRGIEQKTFIPKGQWMAGASFSYLEYETDNYQWVVLEDLDLVGYTFKVSPTVAYFIRDNIGIGGRIGYTRTLTDLGNLSLSLGDDLNIDIDDLHMKSHTFFATAFVRTYLNLGDSKRFGLFNEMSVTYGYGEGNSTNQLRGEPKAVHETKNSLNFGVTPGLTCFINDIIAVEASVDVLGLDFKWGEQTINQVEHGSMRSSGANFKINLFSINLGISFFF